MNAPFVWQEDGPTGVLVCNRLDGFAAIRQDARWGYTARVYRGATVVATAQGNTLEAVKALTEVHLANLRPLPESTGW